MAKPFFYMWGRNRENLISVHEFYVSEGKARLTAQFSDPQKLEVEADQLAEDWLAKASRHFNPDRHDPAAFYEQAHDESIDFYFALDNLGNTARLALIAGMYHQWERDLKKWLTSRDGTAYWGGGKVLQDAIWRADFGKLFELFEGAGLFTSPSPIKDKLDTCRLVVNTYKHGSGQSEANLLVKRPELFDRYGIRSQDAGMPWSTQGDYEDLYVGDNHIDEFSAAIVAFWKAIPENVSAEDFKTVPKWFEKAWNKGDGVIR